MSTKYIEVHVCDVCETDFDPSLRAWMTITAPNLDGEQSFDFCSWDCLVVWVGSQGEDEDAVEEQEELPPVEPVVDAPITKAQAEAMQEVVTPVFQPAMSLADAIASGALEDSFRRARGQ